MIIAIIDIGSNTIRMNVYRVRNGKFRLLFSKKATAGIVSYVQEGRLNKEGISILYSTLDSFNKVLQQLQIEHCFAFATASLRNIDNTKEVLLAVEKKTGRKVNVIEGRQEALLSFYGASLQLQEEDGVFVDIGGGSSEVVSFERKTIISACSMPIGSLNLFNLHVNGILPTQQEIDSMRKHIERELHAYVHAQETLLFAAGGSARAIEKMLLKLGQAEHKGEAISMAALEYLLSYLCSEKGSHLLLRNKPERIHTLIPGLLILMGVMQHCQCTILKVGRYGIREGYLMKVTKKLQDK